MWKVPVEVEIEAAAEVGCMKDNHKDIHKVEHTAGTEAADMETDPRDTGSSSPPIEVAEHTEHQRGSRGSTR